MCLTADRSLTLWTEHLPHTAVLVNHTGKAAVALRIYFSMVSTSIPTTEAPRRWSPAREPRWAWLQRRERKLEGVRRGRATCGYLYVGVQDKILARQERCCAKHNPTRLDTAAGVVNSPHVIVSPLLSLGSPPPPPIPTRTCHARNPPQLLKIGRGRRGFSATLLGGRVHPRGSSLRPHGTRHRQR